MAEFAVSALVFAGSLAVLLKASDAFTSAAERLGLALGISPFVIGVTIVAGGTSLPELVSSVLAVLQGAPEIVVGNVVGSNVANICLILGLAAVVGKKIRVDRELMRVDLPLLTASATFLLVAVWDSPFSWIDGLLSLSALVVYMHFALAEKDETVEEMVEELVETEARPETPPVGWRTYATLVVGLVFVFVAANLLVESILGIAAQLDVGAEFVAVTAVSIGTSLPEISVSVVSARAGKPELAVGNILGSNIFNTFAVMGVPSLVGTLSIPPSIRNFGLPAMVLVTLLYYFITQDREITRWEGATLLALYALFLVNFVGAG